MVAAQIDSGFGAMGMAHGQESTVYDYVLSKTCVPHIRHQVQ
jgi:hypothetical protein